MIPALHLEPLWNFPIPRVLALANASFSDYHISIQVNEASFSSLLVSAGVGFSTS